MYIFNFIHHRNDKENNFKTKDKTSRSKHKQAHCNDKATCYTYLQNKLAEERYLARNLWLRDLTSARQLEVKRSYDNN